MNKKKFITTMILLIIDQLVKGIIQTLNVKCDIISNIFGINYTTNTGAAFSLFSGQNTILIIIGLITLILIYSLSFSYKDNNKNDITFGIIYAGTLGNLIDRLIFGYVRDFISVGSFPIFNLADMFIVIGVILLIILGIINDKEKKEVKKDEDNSRRNNRHKNRQVSN